MRTSNSLRHPLLRGALAPLLAIAFVGCGDGVIFDSGFVNVFTGQTCSPNAQTFIDSDADWENNGNVSPTGIPGDNMDDLRSGRVDCLGDGNSGQGDDKKRPECQMPQPGCDDEGCCECGEDPVDEDPVDEDPVDEDPVDEEPVDEEPVDETPVDETPVDETPVDETPVDEEPAA